MKLTRYSGEERECQLFMFKPIVIALDQQTMSSGLIDGYLVVLNLLC